MTMSQASPLVPFNKGDQGRSDGGGDPQSPPSDWPEMDEIAIRCGHIVGYDRGHGKGRGLSQNVGRGGRS